VNPRVHGKVLPDRQALPQARREARNREAVTGVTVPWSRSTEPDVG
jgi:hypothetical protein